VPTHLPDQKFTSCIRTIRTSTHPVVWHPASQNCICGDDVEFECIVYSDPQPPHAATTLPVTRFWR